MQFDRPFNRYSINVENSRQSTSWSTEWGNCRAFGWSRHWLVASPASVRRPAAKRTHWTILTWKLQDVTVTLDNNWDSGVFKGGGTVRCPPFGPTIKIFYRRIYIKRCVFAVFQQELQNSTMFDGLFSYRYNMRLKSPCEIASAYDALTSPSAFENQLQAVSIGL